MRKIAAIALALIIAMSSMFATVAAAAGDGSVANDFAFEGFKILNPGVVVDVKNMLIYGLNTLVDSESQILTFFGNHRCGNGEVHIKALGKSIGIGTVIAA